MIVSLVPYLLTLKKTLRDFDYFLLTSIATFESFEDQYFPTRDFRYMLEKMGIATMRMCLTARDLASPYSYPPNHSSYTPLASSLQQNPPRWSINRQEVSEAHLGMRRIGPESPQSPMLEHWSSLLSPNGEMSLGSSSVAHSDSHIALLPPYAKDEKGQWKHEASLKLQGDITTEALADWTTNDTLLAVPVGGSFDNCLQSPENSNVFQLNSDASDCSSGNSQGDEVIPIHITPSQERSGDSRRDCEQDLLDAFLVAWSDSPPPLDP